MDYTDGTELVKYQWNVIHDPQNKLFSWMQGEEEGQMVDQTKYIAVFHDGKGYKYMKRGSVLANSEMNLLIDTLKKYNLERNIDSIPPARVLDNSFLNPADLVIYARNKDGIMIFYITDNKVYRRATTFYIDGQMRDFNYIFTNRNDTILNNKTLVMKYESVKEKVNVLIGTLRLSNSKFENLRILCKRKNYLSINHLI